MAPLFWSARAVSVPRSCLSAPRMHRYQHYHYYSGCGCGWFHSRVQLYCRIVQLGNAARPRAALHVASVVLVQRDFVLRQIYRKIRVRSYCPD
jgi:hypothetical protein